MAIPKFVKYEICNAWAGESLYLMLLKDTHVENEATQQYISHVSANEIAATTGYALGGIPITSLLAGYNPLALNNAFLDSTANITIGPGANLNYRYGAVYKNTGNPATSPIRAQVDFLTNQIVANGSSVIQWNSLGIIYIQ